MRSPSRSKKGRESARIDADRADLDKQQREQHVPRNQFGGKFGGPFVMNKLFFFLDGERTKQDSFAPVLVSGPLSGLEGGFSQPFRETNLLGRLDYDLGHNAKIFYRYSYFANLLDATFGFGVLGVRQ